MKCERLKNAFGSNAVRTVSELTSTIERHSIMDEMGTPGEGTRREVTGP